MSKVRWGVLGVAKIALDKFLPPTTVSAVAEVVAIASRSIDKARAAAARFGVPRAYGSYDELLADPRIDAVYNPLPNHLHVPWTVRALEAGKHVLCEKPIALDAAEARTLLDARARTGRLVQEAVMVKTHPRWLEARALVHAGRIGELRAVQGYFSYHNVAPENVRNQADLGGGGLLDIGFYPITMTRFLFGAEPTRVVGALERDPRFGVDRLASAILEFPGGGQAVFTCATQLAGGQSFTAHGTRGHLSLPVPWSAPADGPSLLLLDDGTSPTDPHPQRIAIPACDQWGLHVDGFSVAIRDGAPAPVPIEDAVANMQVIDAIFRSSRTGRWETS